MPAPLTLARWPRLPTQLVWCLSGLLLAAQPLFAASLINVDFNQNNGVGWGGGGPNPGPTMSGAAVLGSAGDQWNGISVSSGTNLPLKYADGSASAIKLTFTAGGGYDANSYGGTSSFAATPYASLMEDYLYTGGPQKIILAGLATNAAYQLVLYSAANAGSGARTTYFTVHGQSQAVTGNSSSNTLVAGVNYARFPLVLSDATGNLVITFCGDGLREGDLNGLQLQASPLPISGARTGTNLALSVAGIAGFNYQWQWRSNLVTGTWLNLSTNQPLTTGPLTFTNGTTGAAGYYRLQVATNPASLTPWLHATDTNLVDATGRRLTLRGLNFGGWFIMEKWMCPLDSGSLADTYAAITNLDARFGVATEQSLIYGYQTNWITLTDLNNLTNGGYNCIRMPVWWGNFYSITNTTPTGWRADAFTVLDWLVTNCAARGIYVVIDMHGVVGGQSASDSTGRQNLNEYWTNTLDQQQTAYMWSQLAAHYANNPTVAGYDLLNEPFGAPSNTAVWNIYTNLYSVIRAVDPRHICIMEGTFNSWNWSMLPNPATYGWTNIMYSMHEYQWGGSVATIEAGSDNQVVDWMAHAAWNVPDYVGEWNDMGQGAACYDYSINAYDTAGVSWSMWAYKATHGLGTDGWGWYNLTYWPTTPNLSTDSAAAIANAWKQWRTTTSFGVNPAVGL
ncbi:MAG TPA: cellulase family glycosylhydrolase [Verrucomicrobiae bacterium]